MPVPILDQPNKEFQKIPHKKWHHKKLQLLPDVDFLVVDETGVIAVSFGAYNNERENGQPAKTFRN